MATTEELRSNLLKGGLTESEVEELVQQNEFVMMADLEELCMSGFSIMKEVLPNWKAARLMRLITAVKTMRAEPLDQDQGTDNGQLPVTCPPVAKGSKKGGPRPKM
jgi:hypothetical protein